MPMAAAVLASAAAAAAVLPLSPNTKKAIE
jgi:hypothetical protein